MKTIAIVILLSGVVHANPYFRPIDPSHPAPVFGALLAPERLGASEAASLLPLVTHSPNDGCLLPSIVCEDWTPLAVGVSMNAGKITFDMAPLANVLPWMQAGLKAVLPERFQLGELSAASPKSVTFSAGPVWEYKQITNKGYFRIFTGLALNF